MRGFIAAYDAESGQQVWKTYTIPGPGEPGHDTLEGDTRQRGGASVWMTGTYDPETNLTYWGTGNGSPWFGDQRPGDNLYTSSTIAVDPDKRRASWLPVPPRTTPGTGTMNAPMVIDYEKDGRSVMAKEAVAQRLPVLARALVGRPDQLRRRDQLLREAGRVRRAST